jgi:ribosomal-protein-alanine N-acetyltransferase
VQAHHKAGRTPAGEILYLLNRQYWGHGYATEAVRAVLGFGFRELGLHRVYATCRPANVASSRVMEKVGMQREGHLRRHRWMKGAWHDSLLYAILEDEWPKQEI